jgi:signal transduction histidine kinase/ligand-binding sensor domain-containing protein
MNKCALLSAFIAFGLCAAAGAATVPRYLARSWQSEDGLPSNVVRAVAQATDGYLWIGTPEGVVRFDGQRFTALRTSAGPMLGRLPIRALFALANGEVWVTTNSHALLRGRGLWLEEVSLPGVSDGASPSPISQIVLGEAGQVFVVRGAEVWHIGSDKSARLAERTATLEKLLQKDAAAQADQGVSVDGRSGVRLRTAQGEVWEFTSEGGLTLTDSTGRMNRVSVRPEAPSGGRALFQDREGNLWLGTHSQGLWRLRPSRVDVLTAADGLSDRTVQLVLEDRAGGLWLALREGGLDHLSADAPSHFDFGPPKTQRAISALLETRTGTLWAATSEAQVYSWKDGAFDVVFPKVRGPGKINAMVEDECGHIWFGGRNGLSVWDGKERKAIDFGSAEIVNALASVGATIWAGTESGRVFRGTGERFEPVAGADGFGQQPISSLLPDANGSLWVGTMGAGLFHVREGRSVSLAERIGDMDPRITCVLDDGAGFLWMGTLGGICRVEKARLLSASPGQTGLAVILDRSDGLLTRECTRGGQPAGWRGRDGTLYFSTGHGLARVDPEQLVLNLMPPRVVVEEASAGGRSIALDSGRAEVGPGRSRLVFRYTALTFTAPEKVRFRTLLEGLDETWRDAGTQRAAGYEAVPPGRYRFRVMAENGDGVWNEAGAALAIEVLPHFWETRWFRVSVALLAALLAVAVGALITRARMRGRMLRLEAQTSREKERARIAQDLHDDLGASLTEISLLANLAAEERQPNSDDDDTLPEVAAKAQALVGALDEIVWAINPRHDTLRSLAEYLAAFGGKHLGRAGITLRRDVPRDLPGVSLDAERRHSIFLAAREALNNAVKHSEATEVWLRVKLEAGEVKVCVEDNGRGLRAGTDEFGEGLRNMRERMKRIGGACEIESAASGTRVQLSLPLASNERKSRGMPSEAGAHGNPM